MAVYGAKSICSNSSDVIWRYFIPNKSSDSKLPLDTLRSQSVIKNRIANSADEDETARYEPSHLDLHCLQRYLYWSVGMKRLNFSPL